MSLFFNKRAGPGIEKDAPAAKGLKLFFQILYREFFTLIRLNLLFYLFCVPVVTIPAAYCAMTRITVSMVRDEPYFLWTDFWKTFRMEFKKATATGLLLLFGFVVSTVAVWFYWGIVDSNAMFWLLTAVAASGTVLLLFMSYSLFPMIGIVSLPMKAIFKNAYALVSASFFHYLAASLVCAALMVVFILLYPVSLTFLLFLYPSLLNLITVFGAYGGISKHVLREE